MIVGHMGKFLAAGDIADSIYSFVAGAQSAISYNTICTKFHPRGWQHQSVNGRSPANSNKKMTCIYGIAVGECQCDITWLVLTNADNVNAFDECDPV